MDGWIVDMFCMHEKKNLSHCCNRNHPGYMASGKNQSIKIACYLFFTILELSAKSGIVNKRNKKENLLSIFSIWLSDVILFCFVFWFNLEKRLTEGYTDSQRLEVFFIHVLSGNARHRATSCCCPIAIKRTMLN